MRLPQPLVDSPFFNFSSFDDLSKALGESISPEERAEMALLVGLGLPPVTSRMTLATMFGINPGLIWSFVNRTERHYRTFTIPRGKAERRIDAPRVALKVIQTWLSVQLQRFYLPPLHVYGFIPGKSHVDAAKSHCGAQWVFSVDIKDFFPSTPSALVESALCEIGFTDKAATLVTQLTCLRGALAQGAPSSPVLSNICFRKLDVELLNVANSHDVRLSRYADDIVFSGKNPFPEKLQFEVENLFASGPWRLAEQKTHLAEQPNRLKVHGLLVHTESVRLTKGYRNKIRAYRHLLANGRVQECDIRRIRGHIAYGEFVDRKS